MRKYIVIVALGLCSTCFAQSFEEQYRSFQQAVQEDYTDFRAQANQRYVSFLRSAWAVMKQEEPILSPKEDVVPPVIYDEQSDTIEQTVIEAAVLPVPPIQEQPQPLAPVIETEYNADRLNVVLYGTKLALRKPSKYIHLSSLANDSLASAWEQLMTDDTNNLLYDCLIARDGLHLSDWAYVTMLGILSDTLCTSTNDAVLLQTYLYTQSGYAARMGKTKDQLYLLVGSEYQLFNRGYYEINGMYFYPLEEVKEGIEICYAGFEQEQPLTLNVPNQRLTPKTEDISRGTISDVSITCFVNSNQIDFYNDCPTGQIGSDSGTRWAVYANAPMDETVRISLYPTLMSAVGNKSEYEAVSLLLNWVQTAFEYEYDDKVWGQDRAFFPSETLHYPYADCEDRSILFSRIVRDLMKLDVVLLYYPGHLATAVAFHQDVKGDYVMVDGKKFVVCDPTYINAPVGKTMPGMDNQTAKVIKLNK